MKDQLAIIAEALKVLPARVRDDYQGIAYLKLAELSGVDPQAQIKSLKTHVLHRFHRDRPRTLELIDRATRPTVDLAEMRDELSRLSPTDRTIVMLIAASCTWKEVSEATGIPTRSIARRLRAIRERANAD